MKPQPVLFIGHGSPLNVLSGNLWTQKILELGKSLARPSGVVMISAHWVTDGVKVLGASHPETIHDFSGFPAELRHIQYGAVGDPALALQIQKLIPQSQVTSDWGFDHGTWGVLKFLIPQADIPVVQISLNARATSKDFFDMGQRLQELRHQNYLIVGSGNVVHNLQQIDFLDHTVSFPWAAEFDGAVKDLTLSGDVEGLINFPKVAQKLFHQAHPTSEHWAPFLICLGAANNISKVQWIYEGIQNGSISMRSAVWDDSLNSIKRL